MIDDVPSSQYVKYPRTPHLPWSHPDDEDDVIDDLSGLEGQEVVATVKLDGEQTSMYRDRIHVRSVDMAYGPSRSRVKAIWSRVAWRIPPGWRLCGENMYAMHSIHYRHLASWFYLFSIWDDKNECLDWDATGEWAQSLDLHVVPELYRGPWDLKKIRALDTSHSGGDPMEGYVVRTASGFPYRDFKRQVAKYVRQGHVATDDHWRHKPVVANQLAPAEGDR